MTAILFKVSATDPATFAGVALLLTLLALTASYIPARRATRIDDGATGDVISKPSHDRVESMWTKDAIHGNYNRCVFAVGAPDPDPPAGYQIQPLPVILGATGLRTVRAPRVALQVTTPILRSVRIRTGTRWRIEHYG